jgi:hypothetical protein
MSERAGVSYGLANTMPVLHVTAEIAYARVEDIAEGILPQEEVTDDTHAPRVSVVHPQAPQISYRVDCLLGLSHVLVELLEGHLGMIANLCDCCAVFFDEADDSLAVVFRDVLGLVLHPLLPCLLHIHFHLHFFLLGNKHLLLAILVLRYASLLGDHPRFLIEV